MKNPTFSTRWNADAIDEYYLRWKEDPDAVDTSWRAFFEGFELALDGRGPAATASSRGGAPAGAGVIDHKKQARVQGAIYAMRSIGHTQARFNPLVETPLENPRLTLERLGFTEADLEDSYDTGNYLGGKMMTVRELLSSLKATYCGPIAVEYLHIQETPQRRWLQSRMEPVFNCPEFSPEREVQMLAKIIEAETFETFLHNRYAGQKRFSLQGGETIIAALDALIQMSPSHGIEEITMGMAHRGRLTVLATILGKSTEFMFQEFAENYIPSAIMGDGDVKYHLGYDSVITTQDGEQVAVRLAANPSHLEAVDPVVEGRARARQRKVGDEERKRVLPVLVHGDAAFAGQGMVAEVFNLSQLQGYTTGGTVHFIINNQIGFTTDPTEARSSRYCTDVAKMIEAPIFHVNGDDPNAVAWATQLALEFRQEFNKDVVVDMYCYRKLGHNEADEPAFTQPLLYAQIRKHPAVSVAYSEKLIAEGDITREEFEEIGERHRKSYEEAFEKAKELASKPKPKNTQFIGSTATFQPPYSFHQTETAVTDDVLRRVARTLCTFPDDFKINPKIKRQLESKWKALEADEGIDWALAEQLAWGTLLLDGTPVRLSGQDCIRGTFSQRHAAFFDFETKEKYVPLMNLEGRKSRFCAHNSCLSEAAVLGFDFGYSLDHPEMLCMWEAQFGDFANGAQMIIDQFITSSESKWQQVSGIVLLLPHGYEGQGPEHSSARPERFLQACAEENIQVCNLSTPAQYFHVLRRQTMREFRKPLIIMSPKSLLRHKSCVSKAADFTTGCFLSILDDPDPPEKANRVILCSGKVYYDLVDFKRINKVKDAAIVRVEQFYPFNRNLLKKVLGRYGDAETIVWCQEESRNMGGWTFMAPIIEEVTGTKPAFAGRAASASPAVGSLAIHKVEQAQVKNAAFFS